MNPRWPIYIPSKGRAKNQLTMRAFDRMRVPYRVIVEEQEHREYADALGADKLMVLDRSYQERYDTFDDLGDSITRGSGPARNFAWEHSIGVGASWHWIVDDNIRHFYRMNNNLKVVAGDGTIFRCMEDFAARYKNVALAGPFYEMFAPRKAAFPPFILNSRIFSCILVRNDVPFRWRCRYNEDTDLSLRVMKAGWCTIEFYAFLQQKIRSLLMAGGNTDELYRGGERNLEKSQMLVRAHPDVARLVWRYGRWHHHVDYSSFKRNKLLRRDGLELTDGNDEYGMVLRPREAGKKLADSASVVPVVVP